VVSLGYLLSGLGLALNAFASTFRGLLACMAIFTLGEMIAMPVSSAYISELAPAHMRGRYMGTYGLTWTVAQVFGPGIGMWLFSAGNTWYWMTATAIGVTSAILVLEPRANRPASLQKPAASGALP
jgi:MFS family permease